ncbi:MAG: histidine phosphatase family protein [Candidatus Woesearchaeota archaeon]
MKIYFVRHAQTTANKQQRIEGHTHSSITEEGRKQANEAANKLQNTQFEATYSSDLTRCKETAEIILTKHNNKLLLDKRIRGRNYGKYEAKPVGSIDWSEEGITFENEENYTQRILAFIEEIQKKHTKNVLVVTHGGVIRRTLHYFCEHTKEEAMDKNIENGSVLIVDIDANTCTTH